MSRTRNITSPPSGITGLDGAVAWLLKRAFDHERVYPDSIPVEGDIDTANPNLPAVAYRQLSGFRQDYLDRRASDLQTASVLTECFARDRTPCSQFRDQMQALFAGPCPPDPRLGPLPEDAPWEPVEVGKICIYSIEAGDPAADADFGFGELHQRFAFVQVILTLSYLQG